VPSRCFKDFLPIFPLLASANRVSPAVGSSTGDRGLILGGLLQGRPPGRSTRAAALTPRRTRLCRRRRPGALAAWNCHQSTSVPDQGHPDRPRHAIQAQMNLQDSTVSSPGQLGKHLPEIPTDGAAEHSPSTPRDGTCTPISYALGCRRKNGACPICAQHPSGRRRQIGPVLLCRKPSKRVAGA